MHNNINLNNTVLIFTKLTNKS